MERARTFGSAVCLVAHPLLILAYWLTYPAYGKLAGDDIIRAVDRDPSMTALSDVFAFLGAVLAVPAYLALVAVLRSRTPRLAWLGGTLSAIGWIAVTVTLMTDVLAVEIAHRGPTESLVQLFKDVLSSPFVIALNATASLHIIGGVLIGVALLRSGLMPRSVAVAATVAPPVHLVANLAGVLWLDAITWVVVAAAFAFVIPVLLTDAPQASDGRGRGRPAIRARTSASR
jgi:hypothetical protein